MTSENKIALIIAFSVLMVVGVLISDHFSTARDADLQGVEATESPELPPSPRLRLPERDNGLGLIASGAESVRSSAEYNPVSPQGYAPGSERNSGWSSPYPSSPPVTQPIADRTPPPVEIRQRGVHPIPVASALTPTLREETRTAAPVRRPERATPEPTPSVRPYRVVEGDTLFDIAAKFLGDGRRWREIKELNRERLAAGDILRAGVEIKIPLPAGSVAESPARSIPRSVTPTRTATAERTYTVESGDALSLIAQDLLGSSKRMDEIIALNRETIDDADDIRVGMVLKIPAR